jgi:hypothetical protein
MFRHQLIKNNQQQHRLKVIFLIRLILFQNLISFILIAPTTPVAPLAKKPTVATPVNAGKKNKQDTSSSYDSSDDNKKKPSIATKPITTPNSAAAAPKSKANVSSSSTSSDSDDKTSTIKKGT